MSEIRGDCGPIEFHFVGPLVDKKFADTIADTMRREIEALELERELRDLEAKAAEATAKRDAAARKIRELRRLPEPGPPTVAQLIGHAMMLLRQAEDRA